VRIGSAHLGYCSNIHPGESWREVREQLALHIPAVRQRVAPGEAFGIGLRLSARAAQELADPAALAELRAWLAAENAYVFTVNGFPHGSFHGSTVKSAVYEPDWRDPERLRYTLQLAELLAQLAPPDGRASLSSVPLGYGARLGEALPAMVEQLIACVAGLVALRGRSGITVTLALEPEPDCVLQTLDEVLALFSQHLHSDAAADRLAQLSGLTADAAHAALREHLGLCLDACHAAVEFEDVAEVLTRLQAAGIAIAKLQISAGLRLPQASAAARDWLARFDDPVYLHQVVARAPDGALTRYPDLPQALASPLCAQDEWRVHFHVPVFLEQLGGCHSTQPLLGELLALQRERPFTEHLEVETYTWDVLPEPWRQGGVDEAIARELVWVRATLQA
jgi:sugar phosphate isomerase/epimerase